MDAINSRRQESNSSLADFLNTSLESRRLFSEALGTFFLVLVSVGGGTVRFVSGGELTLEMAVLCPGLMVMAIIYFMGTVSGAHLNPAVTFAFAARRNFPWKRVPGYVIAQFVGGMCAVYFLYFLFGEAISHGATVPGHGFGSMRSFALETVLTMGLVSVILGTASGARNIGTNGAIAVGGYIILAHMWCVPMTGTSMNPVRSLAPDLVRGDLSTTWIYITAPFLGALVGVGIEWILKGKPTTFGTIAAQGSLGMDDEEKKQD